MSAIPSKQAFFIQHATLLLYRIMTDLFTNRAFLVKNPANEQKQEPIGFLLINKEKNVPSFRCIAQTRRVLGNNRLKVGFAGTLDPFANGLMIVGIGRPATRMLHTVTKWDKRYIARAKLGQMTDTLDRTGQITQLSTTPVTEQDLLAALESFGTQYTQIPPIYSALKHEGLPLYKQARQKGVSVETLRTVVAKKARTVQLYELKLCTFEPPFFTIEAHVSHGTYIRTLLNDIAEKAGSCATTCDLERVTVGKATLRDAIDLASIQTAPDITNRLLSVDQFSARFF